MLPPAWRRTAFDRVGSTNDEAKAMARSGAPHRTVVTAAVQEAGRGRRGRNWSSPAGNLYASLVLRPAASPAVAAQLSFVATLALAEALGPLLPRETAVRAKWPNDVLIDGAKAAGILLESETLADGRLDWLVLGVGVNVRHHPPDTPYAATSLAAAGSGADAEAVLERFLDRFEAWSGRWEAEGFAPVRSAWLETALGLGGPVTVRLAAETLEGRFAGLDHDGTLLVDLPGGAVRRIAAGDVFLGAVRERE